MKVLVSLSLLLAVACAAPQWPHTYPLGIGSGVWPLGLSHYGLNPLPYSLHGSPLILPIPTIGSGIPVVKEIKEEPKEIKSDVPMPIVKEVKSEIPVIMEKAIELPKPVEETLEVKKARESFMLEWEKAARAALVAPDVSLRKRRDVSSVVLPTTSHLPIVSPYYGASVYSHVLPHSYPYHILGHSDIKLI